MPPILGATTQTETARRQWLCRLLAGSAGLAALVAVPGRAWAQASDATTATATAPAAGKPLRIIVPATAGGPSDTWARIIGERLQLRFGRSAVVDNRPGAGGVIGATALLQAPADGDTVMFTTTSTLVLPAELIQPKPYEMNRFVPVGMIARSTIVVLLHPSVPATNTAELVAYIKANPRKIVSSNAGVGSFGGLLVSQFADRYGIDIPQVPYKGGAPAMQAVVAGEVSMFMGDMYQAMPLVQAGKLRVIAQLGLARSEQLPALPTLSESLPGFEGNLWVGVVARAGTPAPAIAGLNRMINDILAEDGVRQKAAASGAAIEAGTPGAFGAVLAGDERNFGALIRKYDIKAE
jgi:tripartite-type tricarboxylate transporter receptor subunit TctC